MNIQSISSHALPISLHAPQIRVNPNPDTHSHSESLFTTDKIPVIPPRKIVELLSLVMSTPDLVRNQSGTILDIRA